MSKRIVRALDAAQPAPTASMWRPIESAPKGDVIRYEPAEYSRGQLSLSARVTISNGAYPRQATHWMPLPPFPESPQ